VQGETTYRGLIAGMMGDADARVQALASTDSLGPDLLKPLIKSPKAWMRKAAIGALGSTGSKAYAQALSAALIDGVADVRLAALRALIDVQGETTYRGLIAGMMGDADARVQALAARSVGRSSANIAAQVRGALMGLLGNASFHVRYEAALALFAHGNKGGLATMQTDQLSTNQSQSAQARYAAAKIQGRVK